MAYFLEITIEQLPILKFKTLSFKDGKENNSYCSTTSKQCEHLLTKVLLACTINGRIKMESIPKNNIDIKAKKYVKNDASF